MSVQPNSILGLDLTTSQGRQALQDVIDQLAGTITKQLTGGSPANPSVIDTLRVKKLYVHEGIDVLPGDKPPAEGLASLVVPFLISRRGRPQTLRYEDQGDGGDLMEWRWQPYPLSTATKDTGDWELAAYSAQRDTDGAFRRIGSIRFGHDGRIRTYTASEILVFDSSEPTSSLPSRYVSGLAIRYASASTITVSAGKARDKADGADMTLSSQVTVDLATVGALGGERKSLTGTASFTYLSTTVTGSGTAFLTEFGVRTGTGTISATASTTITGTGTNFMTEVAVNDLIGTSSGGYARISAIASDTSLTVDHAVTVSGTPGIVENPKIETAGGRTYVVGLIASNTSITLMTFTAATATESNVAIYATSKKCTTAQIYDGWRAVWLLSGGSGTTVVFSTQRTTPYLSTSGYTTSYRRLGWARINSSGNLVTWSTNLTRGYVRYTSGSSVSMRNNANTPAATAVDAFTCETAAPPTAKALQATLASDSPNTATTVAASIRGGVFRTQITVAGISTSRDNGVCGWVDCDGAQGVDLYATAATGDGTGFTVTGWEEELE